MPKKSTCSASLRLALHAMLQVATCNFEGGSSGFCFHVIQMPAPASALLNYIHCREKPAAKRDCWMSCCSGVSKSRCKGVCIVGYMKRDVHLENTGRYVCIYVHTYSSICLSVIALPCCWFRGKFMEIFIKNIMINNWYFFSCKNTSYPTCLLLIFWIEINLISVAQKLEYPLQVHSYSIKRYLFIFIWNDQFVWQRL